jgi:hypothetical protein
MRAAVYRKYDTVFNFMVVNVATLIKPFTAVNASKENMEPQQQMILMIMVYSREDAQHIVQFCAVSAF